MVSVPSMLLGFVAMAPLVRQRMPRLGTTAMLLGYVGSLGFLGIHAVSIHEHAAVDQPDRAAMAALIGSAQNSPLAVLAAIRSRAWGYSLTGAGRRRSSAPCDRSRDADLGGPPG